MVATSRGPSELRDILTSAPDKLARAFVAPRLSRYAAATEVTFADRTEIHRIVESTQKSGHSLGSLIHALAEAGRCSKPRSW